MSRFYINNPLAQGQTISLPAEVYHHWIKVLRANVDDIATVFNGLGGEYQARLKQIDKNTATVILEAFNPINRTPKHQVILGQVMSKGERMDYAIQKATELGVSQIQLLTSERCEMRLKYERDQKKINHWQHIAISACEQCGMNCVPTVHAPMPVEDWLKNIISPLKLVLALEDNLSLERIQKQQHPFTLPLPTEITLLVGPEGGLTEREINIAVQQGFQRWQLGERVLRTETAPLVAMAILNTLA